MKLCNDATRSEEAVAVRVQGRPAPRPRPINFNFVPKERRLTCPLAGVAGDAEDVPDPERLLSFSLENDNLDRCRYCYLDTGLPRATVMLHTRETLLPVRDQVCFVR
jgi:hypothetical protein